MSQIIVSRNRDFKTKLNLFATWITIMSRIFFMLFSFIICLETKIVLSASCWRLYKYHNPASTNNRKSLRILRNNWILQPRVLVRRSMRYKSEAWCIIRIYIYIYICILCAYYYIMLFEEPTMTQFTVRDMVLLRVQ
jgi:hypothetical protein